MVIYEVFDFEGRSLTKAYSNRGMLIRNANGGEYAEAVDPTDTHRTYTETDIPVDPEVEVDAEEALSIITGGEI